LIALGDLAATQVARTDSLNNYATLKINAELYSSLPSNGKEDKLLDALLGYVRDAEPDASVGRTAVGTETLLR
jgi:hypothetical protein